jgi:CRISPR-associated protein Cas6
MTILLDRASSRDDSFSCSEEFGDYCYPVEGKSIPIDHAFLLFSSIAHILKEFHEDNSIGIFGIDGKLNRSRLERLNLDLESTLRIRLPLDRSRLAYKLAGKTLHLHQDKIYLGIPELETIVSSPNLEARLVTIKGFKDATTFATAAQNQIDRLEIVGKVRVLTRPDGNPRCRTVKIHEKKVVGFGVRVEGLSNRDSLTLQHLGIGGRRKLGCGLFAP